MQTYHGSCYSKKLFQKVQQKGETMPRMGVSV